MINVTLNYPNMNSNVTQCVSHMLSKLNLGEYQKFIENSIMFPMKEHNFTVLEYIQSHPSTLIVRSERLPGSNMSIHNIVEDYEFDSNMIRLFISSDNMKWNVRSKLDYSKPVGIQQITDIRQVVVTILPNEDLDLPDLVSVSTQTYDYSDMPSLIPIDDEDDMPPLIPILAPVFNYCGTGLNQTFWKHPSDMLSSYDNSENIYSGSVLERINQQFNDDYPSGDIIWG